MSQTRATRFFKDPVKCLTGSDPLNFANIQPDFRLTHAFGDFIGHLDAPELLSRGGSINIVLNQASGHSYELTTMVRGQKSDTAAALQGGAA